MIGPGPVTPDGMPAEEPVLTLAHLSDTHLTPRGVPFNGLDPEAALDRALAVLRRAGDVGRGPDVVVVSGDLTDTGDPDAYRRLDDRIRPLAPRVVYATGNHDLRTVFHRELLGGAAAERTGPVLQVHRLPWSRIVVLDSTVPGGGHGRLDPTHLAELSDELAAPWPGGTVVVLHHAPLPPPSPLQTFFALERASRSALARVLAGTDTRIVLAGHQHLAASGTLAGIPVAVAGSTAVRTDPLAAPGHERSHAASSVNLVRLYADTVTVSVLPVDDAPEVFDLDPAECAAVIARYPVTPGPAGPPPGTSG
ncbi:metallophosphoesterase family protein [Nakamurella endophytica]|uniref:3',5'-cyclic adenosine monophosphate phosphodiesterase CpdA n=1 Tax=Nakamurella endophytica TaxID=1748367 RepID=A0A917TBM1_9ACTN|nr:metallophosphoesterase [Nakamurella endophytica]GGM17637.1 3',5'-cyclic adenosine monophosphate phosphodiesterase CpdA [Nakamurella endophytica]